MLLGPLEGVVCVFALVGGEVGLEGKTPTAEETVQLNTRQHGRQPGARQGLGRAGGRAECPPKAGPRDGVPRKGAQSLGLPSTAALDPSRVQTEGVGYF